MVGRDELTDVGGKNGVAPSSPQAIFDEIKQLGTEPTVQYGIGAVSELIVNGRNARTHSPRQISKIAASITKFGFLVPILIDEYGLVIAGHGRLEAARQLDMKEVPVILATHLTETQKRAYALADNKLASLAGWDLEILAGELTALSDIELNFDVALTGFDTVEIDQLTSGTASHKAKTKPEVVPSPNRDQPAVTQPGDLWILGPHRVLCGDATQPESYERLMGKDLAQVVFTDPPYNVPIDGHVSGLGAAQHAEFPMASGEMTPAVFTEFLRRVMNNITARSIDGAIQYVCMDWRHTTELLTAATGLVEQKNLCVWVKPNAGMGTFYRSQHELIFVFKNGTAPHINNFGLGDTGRYRTTVWEYPCTKREKRDPDHGIEMHPTVKPVALVMDALMDCSHRNGIVLDPFGGSGTTLIAAHRTGRCGRILELDPYYVDLIVRRWQKETGKSAYLADGHVSFAEAARSRTRKPAVRASEESDDRHEHHEHGAPAVARPTYRSQAPRSNYGEDCHV